MCQPNPEQSQTDGQLQLRHHRQDPRVDRGQAWALHHDQEPPANHGKVDLLLSEIEEIRRELRAMRRLLDEERHEREQLAKLVEERGTSDGEGVWIPVPLLEADAGS